MVSRRENESQPMLYSQSSSARWDESEGLPKLAARLAQNIQSEILANKYQPGYRMGAEPELMDRYGVSRAVLKQAVRLLENSGVAEMRRGGGGGLIVARPNVQAVRAAVSTYLEFEGVTTRDLYQTRVALELYSAKVAAEQISEQTALELRQIVDDEDLRASDGDFDTIAFHIFVAELTKNPAQSLFVEIMAELTSLHSRVLTDATSALAHEGSVQNRHAHRAISEAIIAGDASLAVHRMRSHLDAIDPFLF
jgi:DNA-binding FadR family transcriptional regulator